MKSENDRDGAKNCLIKLALVNSLAHIKNEFCCWFYFYHLLHPQSHNKYIKYVCYFHIRFELHWPLLNMYVCVFASFNATKMYTWASYGGISYCGWCSKQRKLRDKIHLQIIKKRKRSIHNTVHNVNTHTKIYEVIFMRSLIPIWFEKP